MNDVKKLAWKGTPGPWHIEINQRNDILVIGQHKGSEWSVAHTGSTKAAESKSMTATSHLISAAPEAVEFIADLLPMLDKLKVLLTVSPSDIGHKELDKTIALAEEILKKAYNF